MSRPLIISDCDEVLLHMVAPFRDWLAETQDIAFTIASSDFSQALKHQNTGELVEPEKIWPLLNAFFDTEMHRQTPFDGAVSAINHLNETADVVILTNLMDHRAEPRTRQLAEHGIAARVFTNQGPKGPALKAILDEYRPARALFIDDFANHLGSVAETTPHVIRLHLCGEPLLAPHIACARELGHAHARIDSWDQALPWIAQRLNE